METSHREEESTKWKSLGIPDTLYSNVKDVLALLTSPFLFTNRPALKTSMRNDICSSHLYGSEASQIYRTALCKKEISLNRLRGM